MPHLPTYTAIRYIEPLREGGSLPAIVEADDGNLYVMKFVGAGQGPKALIAELLGGEIARTLGFRVPEIVLLNLNPTLGRSEPDPEIQDLLKASSGLNLGMRYLPNALVFNPLLEPQPEPELASDIVWLDAYLTNMDRTARNVNLLIWQKNLWLIDHGAALYFHHSWDDYLARSQSRFPLIKQHVLLPLASQLTEADQKLRPQLTEARLQEIIAAIPVQWLGQEEGFAGQDEHRMAYLAYLQRRLEAAPNFIEEAQHARDKLV